MEQLHRDEWLIGLSSWVIQDGNHVDFAVGERHRFAVGFFGDDLHEGTPGLKQAEAVGEGRYDVSGEVIVADPVVVLAFGLLAYTDSRPPSAARGEWLGDACRWRSIATPTSRSTRRSVACLQPCTRGRSPASGGRWHPSSPMPPKVRHG